jgi:hypothetical protein
MRILRIFPRRTKATPIDELSIINRNPNLFDYADEIHISVSFTYDLPIAEKLFNHWKFVSPCKIGGPALGHGASVFTPGLYLKHGYVITSRGCNNHCWFCSVPKNEGKLFEIPITNGWNILDNNFLACSGDHRAKVFEMLRKQPFRPTFSGGLEAKLLTHSIARDLRSLFPRNMYFAYDTPDDLEHLHNARKILTSVGFPFNSSHISCYVLCGYPGDSPIKAYNRILETIHAGFFPFAMIFRSSDHVVPKIWQYFKTQWTNPKITACNVRKILSYSSNN